MPVMGISSGFSHDFICPIHFSSIPAFPNKPLCDLHQLLKFEGHKYSRVNRGQVRFYDHGSIRLHSDGLMGSRVIEGELYTFDLDEFGTCSLNGSFVERKDGTPYQNIVMSGSFIATCISFSLQFYSHINYEGPVLFRLHSSNLTEFNCSLLNKSAIEDHIELEYECYTHDLADRSNRLLIFDYFVKKFYRNYDFSPEMVDEIYQTEREFI